MSLLQPHYPEAMMLATSTEMAMEAQKLATPEQWQETGRDDYRLWGTLKNGTQVAMYRYAPETAFYCSCKRTVRCSHVLALYILLIDAPDAFEVQSIPEYPEIALYHPFDDLPDDRRHHIEKGLSQLDDWLAHLMLHGLGESHVQTDDFWIQIAERMMAAYLPSVAQQLREIPQLFQIHDEWVQPMLYRLGWLYLLIRSVENFDAHPLPTQMDLRSVLDWSPQLADISHDTSVRDTWVVIGRERRLLNEELPDIHIWLYGTATEQVAVLRHTGFQQGETVFYLSPGYRVDATLVYEPTQGSQRALVQSMHSEPVYQPQIAGRPMKAHIEDFSQKLSRNPWLSHYGIILDEVYPTRFDTGWILRDNRGNYLPISPVFGHQWVLFAMSSGAPIQVVCQWDGRACIPLTVFSDEETVNLTEVPDYK